jgi:hypothetical protein
MVKNFALKAWTYSYFSNGIQKLFANQKEIDSRPVPFSSICQRICKFFTVRELSAEWVNKIGIITESSKVFRVALVRNTPEMFVGSYGTLPSTAAVELRNYLLLIVGEGMGWGRQQWGGGG